MGLALLVVLAYQFGGGKKAAPRTYKPPRSAYEPTGGSSCADAYRRGFDDATAGRKYDADGDFDAYDDEPEGHEPSGGMGSALLSKGLPLFFFGKQVQQLGGSPWNPQVAQRNFMALDPMRKAMFGFLVLRLLGLSPIQLRRSGSAQDSTGVTDSKIQSFSSFKGAGTCTPASRRPICPRWPRAWR